MSPGAVSSAPESGVDAMYQVLTQYCVNSCREVVLTHTNSCREVVLTQQCQHCVNVGTQALREGAQCASDER